MASANIPKSVFGMVSWRTIPYEKHISFSYIAYPSSHASNDHNNNNNQKHTHTNNPPENQPAIVSLVACHFARHHQTLFASSSFKFTCWFDGYQRRQPQATMSTCRGINLPNLEIRSTKMFHIHKPIHNTTTEKTNLKMFNTYSHVGCGWTTDALVCRLQPDNNQDR